MPVTRSISGKSTKQQHQETTPSTTATATETRTETSTAVTSATEETSTETGTSTVITDTTATSSSANIEKKNASVPVPKSTGATRRRSRAPSMTKSTKTRRLAKAREELAFLQVQLANARLAAIEAETTDDEDDDTVQSKEERETTLRVDNWLHTSEQLLAISNEPHRPSTPVAANPDDQEPKVPTVAQEGLPILPQPHIAQLGLAVPVQQNITHMGLTTPINDARHREAQHLQPTPVGEIIVPRPNYFAELTSAITLAIKSGQHSKRIITELPTFFGSHQQWFSFKAAYHESAVMFSVTDNIARLRKCLKGKAREAVEELFISNSGPEEIVRALESRFGRPDSIALTQLELLRALPRLTDSAKDICIFASKVSNIVAALRVLDRVYYLYNPEIIKNILEKLSPTLKYRWFDFAALQPKEEADLIKLSRFLQREAELCSPYAQPEVIHSPTEHAVVSKRTQRTHTTIEKRCVVCKDTGHYGTECEKFLKADIDERWDIAKENRLCFRCLRYRNKTHHCRTKKCDANDCKYTHHKLLPKEYVAKKCENETDQTEKVTTTWTKNRSRSFLKILPVRVSGVKREVDAWALLDDGSTVTLIDSKLASEIGAKGPLEPLHIEALTDKDIAIPKSRRVTLTLRGSSQRHDINARTVNNLNLSPQEISEDDISGCEHLREIHDDVVCRGARPNILIGQDNWHLLLATEVRKGRRNQPVASLTPLGWVLHGAHTRTLGQRVHYVHHMTNIEENMDEQLKHHFAIESLMIVPKKPQSDPEQRALNILEATTVRSDNKCYQTGLLWKTENTAMPHNYDNALRRLSSTEKKIDKEPKLRENYEQQMEALIEKGYAEIAPNSKSKNRTWYLPHFPVLNPTKPGKVRIVHDAAAKTKGVSLNDHLLTGPDLLQPLPGVIMRFRQHRIAVTADIAEMFMRVKIRQEDRDALRYLWRGRNRDREPQEYRMTSLIFGATCSPSTAIFVKNLNASEHKSSNPLAANAIIRNHYVDDYLDSFKTTEEAINVSTDVRDIHSKGNFELRGWASNSQQVLRALSHGDDNKQTITLSNGAQKERILGLIWEPQTDRITFNLDMARIQPSVLTSEEPTKRNALKIMMSLYDPLGFASPVLIKAKQVLQELWRRGTDWDQTMDNDLAEQWSDWIQQLLKLKNVGIPRCYGGYSDAASLELHVFVDASESAYSAVIYWRVITKDGEVKVSLVTAKARVAPLKLTSIPRLELQAATMGSRMAAVVVEEHDHKPTTKTFWTDSKTVLTWIRSGSRTYRPFVAHRIAAIEENTTVSEWRWVPTKLNVADDATRDVPPNFDEQHRWYTGPEFLYQEPEQWPTEVVTTATPTTGEEKTHVIQPRKLSKLSEALPDENRFSKWEKLLGATARVLQFIALCREKKQRTYFSRNSKKRETDPAWKRQKKTTSQQRGQQKKIENHRKYIPLSASILEEAEKLLVRKIQYESFEREIASLERDRTMPKDSKLNSVAVILENGTLKLKSRIDAINDVPHTTKHPSVLDGNHRATKLWIDYTHRKLLHANVETTVNECRQHYWVTRLRPVVKRMVYECLPCRIKKAKPSQPSTGNHPTCRLAHHRRPFTYTGLDYFGPLQVTVGRTIQKRYAVIFTCLTTRAIHLELAASLSTDSAVMALRRMIARRGCPTEIWSDNGTNLRGADRALREAIDERTQEEAETKRINWRFIPPGAPFMGGAWERMVRAVKTALITVLNERHPSEEILATLLAEVEYTVNSRPLTHVSTEPDDEEALTPNHFILGGSARVPVPGSFDENDTVGRTTWRTVQRLADLFWSRWLREYLPDLQNRREPYNRGPPIKIGDVVLIVDNTLPRNTWPRGRVTEIYPGPDGVIRAVDIQTKGGTLRRPTKKLVVLPTEATVLHA